MKKNISFLSITLLMLLSSCSLQKKSTKEEIYAQIELGNHTLAREQIDRVMQNEQLTEEKRKAYLFALDSLHRVELDFRKTRSEVVDWIKKNCGFMPSDSLLDAWEQSNVLEFRTIDGEKRYFRNAAPNIFRVDSAARALSKNATPRSDMPRDSLLIDAFTNKTATDTKGKYLLPKRTIRLRYTLTVEPNAVADGETLKVWLPFPRKDIERQTDVKLLSTTQGKYTLSDDRTVHTSLYMEQQAEKDQPAVFGFEAEVTSRGEWFDLSEITVKPYNERNELFMTYTAERVPHIRFSADIRQLTDSITRDARTPVETLQAVYAYITAHYPWASALEYSTIADIPAYVIKNRKGDCGQVALLLITMLRYKGIPARWQSGWMTHPGEVNLHDWAEVYFEDTGWVPVDVSFGRGGPVAITPGRFFFMSGIDSYRLYINSDYSGAFYPPKEFPRSETVDFQRGEVESRHGNLYFDRWEYDMEITYR